MGDAEDGGINDMGPGREEPEALADVALDAEDAEDAEDDADAPPPDAEAADDARDDDGPEVPALATLLPLLPAPEVSPLGVELLPPPLAPLPPDDVAAPWEAADDAPDDGVPMAELDPPLPPEVPDENPAGEPSTHRLSRHTCPPAVSQSESTSHAAAGVGQP